MTKVIMKWKQRGYFFERGIAYSREIGEEDVVEAHVAKSYVSAGMTMIVGKAESVAVVKDCLTVHAPASPVVEVSLWES